ncbi:hypothetical protein DRE_00310 [Drechslerella stenobrocha 248]|uniref:Uncharacterized protein n=1 Tax=Drechslerella stenobrocha 248 TaxID=1043628 RepID=W7I4F3_9PEZI|nr:hypothetical protein DRE_00310 [Drechslerella stenobrocha 248]
MPRENHIDRAAVQFGSMGLNGDLDDSEEVDQQPEKPETVAQPQQSPIGQPKTSLPIQLSTAAANIASIGPPHAPPRSCAPQHIQQQPQQSTQPLGGSLPRQSGFGGEQGKFDSYGQQPHTSGQQNTLGQSPYGGYQGQTQQQAQPANADPYGNYYGSGDPARNSAFGTFYNTPYQQGQSQQQVQQQQQADQAATQPRSSSALGSGVAASLETAQAGTGSATAAQQQGQQSRFGSTFQGAEGTQPGQGNAQQAPQHPSQYPMHPSYYPYYNYMSQMYNHYTYPKGFYGATPQGYMSPGGYEHSSSPAAYGGFAGPTSQGRDSSLNEYGRTGSSQSHLQQQQQQQQQQQSQQSQQSQQQQQSQHSNLGYGSGGMPDYMSPRQQSQLGGFAQQQLGLVGGGGQQGGHSEEALKPYSEAKASTGPSGNPAGAPGRPPSTGLSGQGGQSQLPQNQSQAQQQTPMGGAAGGYPHHLQGQSQQHNPLMGGGALGNQGSHHNSGYGMYGSFGSYPGYGNQAGNRQQGGWNYGGH